MSIEGRIAIDVSFADSAEGTSVQSLKKIALVDTQAYTTGKVAVVAGTCSTATDNLISLFTPSYTDSSGQSVSFNTITRVAFRASRSARLFVGLTSFGYSNGNLAINDYEQPFGATHLNPRTTAGTASYTLVLYGT